MSDFLNQALFGIYPYVCLAVFFLGSLVRFDREQYTWKSDSSQLLRRGQLRWGSNLFHVGILLLFLGHLVGLLMPHSVATGMGLSNEAHQLLAMSAGAIFGTMCLAGRTPLQEIRFVLFGEPAYRVFEMVHDASKVAAQMERLKRR